ncbi:MAG: T9SS type A sorting domain-containing protein [Bacteroidales bacterium]|nr:T9SS type A sorting domain-containing protein [Bacteroidales bacterium]
MLIKKYYNPERMYTCKVIKPILFIFVAVIILFSPDYSFSQCVPDTTCEDIGDPGQICPDSLPDGTVGIYYEHTATILPPKTTIINDVPFYIVMILLDTITNLPPGLTYQASAKEMYPDTAYCAIIQGTPTETGTYALRIKVIPFINYLGFPTAGDMVVNDTSLAIIIHATSNVESLNYSGFYGFQKGPNPFSDYTRIGCFCDKSCIVELKIFSLVGQVIHKEELYASKGKNLFRFDGSDLKSGTYLYTISNARGKYSGKLIKVR